MLSKNTANINLSEDIISADTRSRYCFVCAAFVLEHYKEIMKDGGQKSCDVAVRCGHLNPQTKYIFSRLGIQPLPRQYRTSHPPTWVKLARCQTDGVFDNAKKW